MFNAYQLLTDVANGVPGALECATDVREAAKYGHPQARAAWREMVAIRSREPSPTAGGPSFGSHGDGQLLDMYERLSDDDPTAWSQIHRLAELSRMGDRQSARLLVGLRTIHQERSAGGYGGPTTTGYGMPIRNRAGFAPYVVVGAGGSSFDPFAALFPNGIPTMPPGLPPLPFGIPMQVPQLPKEMILPLTEQVFETLLQLIRQAKNAGGLDRERGTVVPMDDGLMRAAPRSQAIEDALASVDPNKYRMASVPTAVHAPTLRILQKLTML